MYWEVTTDLICARRQDVISSCVKTETCNGSFVNSQHLDCLRRADVPDANGCVVRGRDDDILAGVIDDAVDLLCVAFENGDNLRRDYNLFIMC